MIRVHDDVLADPQAYRAQALAARFGPVEVGEVVFHGIAPCYDPALAAWFVQQYPAYVPTLTFFRQSPAGQVEPNDIHTDVDMGDLTVILYLTPDPPPEDGTAFWQHRATGTEAGGVIGGAVGRDRSAWFRVRTVPAAFNRCVVFDAALCHSRAVAENYGAGDGARLIQVLFAKGKE